MKENKGDYKKVFYANYVSTHNSVLYGNLSSSKLRKLFPILKYYFKNLLPLNKDAKILDVGCGDGNFVYFLHELGYKNAEGIDVSAEQIQRGKEAGIKAIYQADVDFFLQEKENEYDLIIARDLLEHFTKQEIFDLCYLINRSLKNEGSFIVQVPNGQGVFHTSILYGDFTHEIAFTHSSLSQLFKNAGFKSTRSFSVGPVPYTLMSFVRYILWKMSIFFIRCYKMVVTGNSQGIFTPNIITITKK